MAVKSHRLFKVAKELNVATTDLVETLGNAGHEVENSPNSKLDSDQYDLLLKTFAKEKSFKEKADEFNIRKREETNDILGKTKGEEEDAQTPISAADLRDGTFTTGVGKRRKKVVLKGENGSPTPTVEPTPAEVVPEKETEEPKAAEPETAVEAPRKEGKLEEVEAPDMPGLKVVARVDLEELEGKKKKPAKSKTADKEKAVEAPAPETEKTEVKAEPVTEKTEAREKEVEEPAEKEEASEEKAVIRAGDSARALKGLTVKGKIELEPTKPRKKGKQGEAPSTEEDGGAKTKRKRRRKRKGPIKAEGQQQSDRGEGGGTRKRGKKERPSQQEVDENIRKTTSQLQQGTKRDRQKTRRETRDRKAIAREADEAYRERQEAVLQVTEFITAKEFADRIDVPVNDIIAKSFEVGHMVTINQRMDKDVITLLAEEYEYEVEFIDAKEEGEEEELIQDKPEDLETRVPIITVMGHVDHGKTTLLDYLRSANVTAGEAGGITQHIGAYEIELKSGRKATFIDTPGHEAFTAMRARGAKVTDLVIIVIAADDAIMPQTREAISHAQAADVPMVFALNKIDKAGADPEKIKAQLAEMNLQVEDWGGEYQSQEISALKGTSVEDLLEKVIVVTDLMELKANPNRDASGTVIESRQDKGRGNVATILVQNGTLKVGDEMVAGIHYGKVRALTDQNGKRIKSAGPSTPVQVLGMEGSPQAGDRVLVYEDGSKAKDVAHRRSELHREQQFHQAKPLTLEEITRRRQQGGFEQLKVIIRGDVDGSVEALAGSLLKLSTDEVEVKIVQKSVGAISEADIQLALVSEALVLAFNVRPNAQARILADREGVEIRTYSVIYHAIEDITKAMEGLLSPELQETTLGTAEVKEVFKVTKVGKIAGSIVTTGKIVKNEPVRVIREGVVIYESKLSSLRRYKDDVKEVPNGQECGIMVENYSDVKTGDIIECYHVNEVARTLN